MITLSFDESAKQPKYEQLYSHIKEAIVSGAMARGERLPSKRKLADHLSIGLNTVENAYAQLRAEGFIESAEKRGYYVARLSARPAMKPPPAIDLPVVQTDAAARPGRFVLRNNAVDTASFPFATWSRLMRDSLRADHARLVQDLHPQGDRQLRDAIARYLLNYRSMTVAPERIVVGAGTTYLLGMVGELLPRTKFAIEEPGYAMLARTLQSRNVPYACVTVDAEGMRIDDLRRSGAGIAVVTPSNQFPLCQVMSIRRRLDLLAWANAAAGRYIIEDDYDSDYRYSLKPAPALHSLDESDRVLYFNAFARTLTPSLRIAYMVLPARLMEAYRARRRLYSCTVSGFEQRTLLRFILGGHYERHLNRMRTIYKRRRNAFMDGLRPLARRIRIDGYQAGLHLLLHSRTGMHEKTLVRRAAENDVAVFGLSGFYQNPVGETHCVVAGYGGLSEDDLGEAAARLCRAWGR
ncbi:MAG: PLP-dependent aminotransferase family protein [Planctomycetaceae bacterium]|nr:PLP-dependent aminotransferase family protein [Planctomycetaceae bacterium]